MFQSIQCLKNNGYCPSIIFDIGAHHGNWANECMQIYPSAAYHLFEGIDYPELKRFDGLDNVDVYKAILDEVPRQVDWYEMRNTGDSFFKERTRHFANCVPIKKNTQTLAYFAKNIPFEGEQVFIKIDTQGSEIPILKGLLHDDTGKRLLERTDFIILEIPLFGQYNEGVPNFLEHIQFMDSIGFIPYDFVESHVVSGFNIQVDMMFINKTHAFNKTVQNRLM